MLGVFGDAMVTDLVKEVCIISYEYISQTPRLYSKTFARQYPETNDVSVWDAAGATSAAPIYFNPKMRTTPSGVEEYLIDGGVIENNPSMFAVTMVQNVMEITQPIRLFSLGTGTAETKDIVAEDFSGLDWWIQTSTLMTSITQNNASFQSAYHSQNYLRLQTISTVDLAAADEVDLLKTQGESIIEAQGAEIEQLCRILVEEKKSSLK